MSARSRVQDLLKQTGGILPYGAMSNLAAKLGLSRERIRQLITAESSGTYMIATVIPRLCKRCGLPIRSKIRNPSGPKAGFHSHCYTAESGGTCAHCGKAIPKRYGPSKSGLRFCNRSCRSGWVFRQRPSEHVRIAQQAQRLGWTAERIRNLRARLGLTRTKMAVVLGVKPKTFDTWERDHRVGSEDALRRLERLEGRNQ